MEFEKDEYTVIEDEEEVEIVVLRTGDLSNKTTVYAVTQSGTAESPEDFVEKKKNPPSVVTFEPGKDYLSDTYKYLDLVHCDLDWLSLHTQWLSTTGLQTGAGHCQLLCVSSSLIIVHFYIPTEKFKESDARSLI